MSIQIWIDIKRLDLELKSIPFYPFEIWLQFRKKEEGGRKKKEREREGGGCCTYAPRFGGDRRSICGLKMEGGDGFSSRWWWFRLVQGDN